LCSPNQSHSNSLKRPGKIDQQSSGYERLDIFSTGAVGVAQVARPAKTQFTVEDRWSIKGNEIQFSRNVAVFGTANLGFLTSITFAHPEAHPRSEVDYFAPGMIYGSTQHLSAAAIGGSDTYGAEGRGEIQIREDRLPAPMFGVHDSDGSALTVLDAAPNAATARADSHDADAHTVVDVAGGHHERAAANYAETYIYIWKLPMPADEDDQLLHWKKGVPTYGVQLIATGHSLVDDYMAFDVDEYARLARWTGDTRYLAIATLLLHDTKNMTGIPGRTYDLKGAGWQQEHWSIAPLRGFGLHRGWLPWVATRQLKGILGLQEFDAELYRQLSQPDGNSGH
jgi:hypothetical protein